MNFLKKCEPFALLLLRCGSGLVFIYHGYPKLFGFAYSGSQATGRCTRGARAPRGTTRTAGSPDFPGRQRGEKLGINHLIQDCDATKLQVDFGHDETALIELWQVLED
jgi:DoxX